MGRDGAGQMRVSTSMRKDAVLAVALGVVVTVWTWVAAPYMQPERPIDLRGFAMVVGAALVLTIRRQWPLLALAVTGTLASAYLVVGYPYGPILVALVVAVYTVARYLTLGRALPACAAALAVLLLHLFTNDAALPGLIGVIPGSAWVVVPFAVGVSVRARREYADRARAEAVRQHVLDERLRVAQEVHDVVGHGLAAIKMQADVALHLLAKKPEQAEAALDAISRTSTEALDELRATLAVVRRTEVESPRAPAPGLGRIEDLRQRMSEAGLVVEVDVTGRRRPLPPAADLAAYRVVQESLTNVLRHGRTKVATVRIGYETGGVTLAISNPAEAVTAREDGFGIPGMRQRVASLGGEFSAGLSPRGFFEVRATIPVAEEIPYPEETSYAGEHPSGDHTATGGRS
jgi:signal transduction histidine kinase